MKSQHLTLLVVACLLGAAFIPEVDAFGKWCRCAKWCYKWEYPKPGCGWKWRKCCRRRWGWGGGWGGYGGGWGGGYGGGWGGGYGGGWGGGYGGGWGGGYGGGWGGYGGGWGGGYGGYGWGKKG